MGGCRHRSVAVGGSRKRSAAAKRRTARRVYTLHGSATWLGCSPTTGRRAAIFSNGASKINHLWSKKGSSAPVLVCGGWFCRGLGALGPSPVGAQFERPTGRREFGAARTVDSTLYAPRSTDTTVQTTEYTARVECAPE
jgi:hypothetical protein